MTPPPGQQKYDSAPRTPPPNQQKHSPRAFGATSSGGSPDLNQTATFGQTPLYQQQHYGPGGQPNSQGMNFNSTIGHGGQMPAWPQMGSAQVRNYSNPRSMGGRPGPGHPAMPGGMPHNFNPGQSYSG